LHFLFASCFLVLGSCFLVLLFCILSMKPFHMEQPIPTNTSSSAGRKLLSLFGMTYLLLYMLPFPLDNIPGLRYIATWYNKGMEYIILFTGHKLLHLSSLTNTDNGSGDTTFDYVRIVTILILAIIIAPVVFIISRKQSNYTAWRQWLIIYARYYVGLYMIVYGFIKLFEGQFGSPGIGQLEESYGNASPMGLLWTFMGYSKPYTVFTGILETLAGLLLLFRRTTAIGCLMTMAVMTNVVMLNLFYDVPVKLFSMHLLFIAFIILWPDLKRLYNFFIRHTAATLTTSKLILPKKWMRITRIIVKGFIIVSLMVGLITEIAGDNDEYAKNTSHGLNGMYKTDLFVFNKDTLQAGAGLKRWNKLILDDSYSGIYVGFDSVQYFELSADTLHKKITMTSYKDSTEKYRLTYNVLPDNRFVFSGVCRSDSMYAIFKRKQVADYQLINRGFHWITEAPYNR